MLLSGVLALVLCFKNIRVFGQSNESTSSSLSDLFVIESKEKISLETDFNTLNANSDKPIVDILLLESAVSSFINILSFENEYVKMACDAFSRLALSVSEDLFRNQGDAPLTSLLSEIDKITEHMDLEDTFSFFKAMVRLIDKSTKKDEYSVRLMNLPNKMLAEIRESKMEDILAVDDKTFKISKALKMYAGAMDVHYTCLISEDLIIVYDEINDFVLNSSDDTNATQLKKLKQEFLILLLEYLKNLDHSEKQIIFKLLYVLFKKDYALKDNVLKHETENEYNFNDFLEWFNIFSKDNEVPKNALEDYRAEFAVVAIHHLGKSEDVFLNFLVHDENFLHQKEFLDGSILVYHRIRSQIRRSDKSAVDVLKKCRGEILNLIESSLKRIHLNKERSVQIFLNVIYDDLIDDENSILDKQSLNLYLNLLSASRQNQQTLFFDDSGKRITEIQAEILRFIDVLGDLYDMPRDKFNLVKDKVLLVMSHKNEEISNAGLKACSKILEKILELYFMPVSKNNFYQNHIFSILNHVVLLMADGNYKSSFSQQASLLFNFLKVVKNKHINLPLAIDDYCSTFQHDKFKQVYSFFAESSDLDTFMSRLKNGPTLPKKATKMARIASLIGLTAFGAISFLANQIYDHSFTPNTVRDTTTIGAKCTTDKDSGIILSNEFHSVDSPKLPFTVSQSVASSAETLTESPPVSASDTKTPNNLDDQIIDIKHVVNQALNQNNGASEPSKLLEDVTSSVLIKVESNATLEQKSKAWSLADYFHREGLVSVKDNYGLYLVLLYYLVNGLAGLDFVSVFKRGLIPKKINKPSPKIIESKDDNTIGDLQSMSQNTIEKVMLLDSVNKDPVMVKDVAAQDNGFKTENNDDKTKEFKYEVQGPVEENSGALNNTIVLGSILVSFGLIGIGTLAYKKHKKAI
ncbi:hypothetical protein O9G_004999 [Rozella allomycis CSF55]|uniref:Exportin-1 C-terminal domain-containing protein n=1 Tax=Rozella allomycis (strain CSF55) TaxID=988480 RepID=A0A075ASK8_ROZAC|nr:hypothetical protein O9G_004999 [Rozella allomycis CSF55]|eukprot:EPZ33130.1 hypothetical protein O9G_004999 [Rozella allomycis CSF55]